MHSSQSVSQINLQGELVCTYQKRASLTSKGSRSRLNWLPRRVDCGEYRLRLTSKGSWSACSLFSRAFGYQVSWGPPVRSAGKGSCLTRYVTFANCVLEAINIHQLDEFVQLAVFIGQGILSARRVRSASKGS